MALQDPVVVYNAATNVEAHLVKLLLIEAGMEAFVSEDLSTGGLWMFGLLPGIHKPQVWVSRSRIDEAQPVLERYERQEAERRRTRQQTDSADSSPVQVVCEECGKSSLFPSAQRGSVQDCPHCRAYVDVTDNEPSDSSRRHGGEMDEP